MGDEPATPQRPLGKAATETLAIPDWLREQVDERDGWHCRVCGKYLGPEGRAMHHIFFGGTATGMGGRRRHELTNLITVCWMWGGNCHDLVHGQKARFQPVLADLASGRHLGMTAQQVLRWSARSSGGQPFNLEEVRRRFNRHLQPQGDCLVWTGSLSSEGYGVLNYKALKGRPVGAHRVAWFFEYGQWPDGHLLHSCDNPPCCRVDHLRVGTQTENMEDRKQRNPRFGAANPNARHAELVRQIRSRVAAGESQASVGRLLGIPSGTVSRIVRGVSYPLR